MHDLEIVERLYHAPADFEADMLGLHGVVQSGQHDGVDAWNGCDVHFFCRAFLDLVGWRSGRLVTDFLFSSGRTAALLTRIGRVMAAVLAIMSDESMEQRQGWL